MRIAVTGGCGFIGSHVVDCLLLAGHDVLVIDRRENWANPGAEYLISDVFNDQALERALDGRDAVFHLAGVADVNEVTTRPGGGGSAEHRGHGQGSGRGAPREVRARPAGQHGVGLRRDRRPRRADRGRAR